MPFPRALILEACTLLGRQMTFHGQVDDLMLRWELDDHAQAAGTIHQRFQRLFLFVRDNPDVKYDGRLISDLLVEKAAKMSYGGDSEEFLRVLERAGYDLDENRNIRRILPEVIDLPAADDEVHTLLNRYHLATPFGHLDQAIDSHTRSHWAAANSQIRSFLESLLDEIAYMLVPNVPRGQTQGEARREALANLQPPFLSVSLFEWGNQGKNLLNGVFKRLHPQGAHPGLSDEEDSTFRLHLVLLLGRLFLRRLDSIHAGRP